MYRSCCTLAQEDFISGDRFPGICDFISQFYDRVDERRFPSDRVRRSLHIYYADTHCVENLWPKLHPDNEYVIVSHNSDAAIVDSNPRDCDVLAESVPDNVVAWFGQNIDTQHPKVRSLPIGLENDRWFPDVGKKQRIMSLRGEHLSPRRLLYVNCNVDNNAQERRAAYDACSWATVEHGKNGHGFVPYIHNIIDHFYVLCPRGNGIDCHRTWETLYLCRVPVMLRHRNAEFYQDLPILFVDSWDEVTEDFLESKKEEFLLGGWNFDKLRFQYWRDQIHNAAL